MDIIFRQISEREKTALIKKVERKFHRHGTFVPGEVFENGHVRLPAVKIKAAGNDWYFYFEGQPFENVDVLMADPYGEEDGEIRFRLHAPEAIHNEVRDWCNSKENGEIVGLARAYTYAQIDDNFDLILEDEVNGIIDWEETMQDPSGKRHLYNMYRRQI
ncbi:MAG: hypothetical protein ACI4FX_10795 [Agathobacter sp.]